MIPKIIHYCWLGDDPYPKKIQFCIDSWKRLLPDYELMLWDKHRFDIESVRWVKEAYQQKKYAFAADYIRCYALYNYGGIYLDSDVEVVRSYNELLELPYFLGRERVSGHIEAATMGFEKSHPLFRYLMDYYERHAFIENGKLNTRPMPRIIRDITTAYYREVDIEQPKDFVHQEDVLNILPSDYFSPKENEHIYQTENTYSIHHYTGTWHSPIYNWMRKIILTLFGARCKEKIASMIHACCSQKK
ncbi:MAG: glycosyl transferase [Paludibacteraceae bacterium]|nr:glycosyl transferase [Paludibacteraceae bacterium]